MSLGYSFDAVSGGRDVNGNPVYVGRDVAPLLAAMVRDFNSRGWGTLTILEGGRTKARQTYLWNGWVKRLPGFNTAAFPGTSKHEFGFAVDFGANFDSYDDLGWHRLETIAARYGFDNVQGRNTKPRPEPWHWVCTPSKVSTAAVAGGEVIVIPNVVRDERLWAIQAYLVELGYVLTVDGFPGPQTTGVVKQYQSARGLTADGVPGRVTIAALEHDVQTKRTAAVAAAAVKKRGKGKSMHMIQGDTDGEATYGQIALITDGGYFSALDGPEYDIFKFSLGEAVRVPHEDFLRWQKRCENIRAATQIGPAQVDALLNAVTDIVKAAPGGTVTVGGAALDPKAFAVAVADKFAARLVS